jgi:hypothetical protein
MFKVMRKILIFNVVLLALPFLLFSFGKKEPKAPVVPQDPFVEVTGIVHLVGSEPFPELVITDDEDNNWYIDNNDRKTLSRFVQERVTVRGTVRSQDMILANNQYVGTRKILSDLYLRAD